MLILMAALNVEWIVGCIASGIPLWSNHIYYVEVIDESHLDNLLQNKAKRSDISDDNRLLMNGNPIPTDIVSQTIYISVDMDTQHWDKDRFMSCNDSKLYFLQCENWKNKQEMIQNGTAMELYCINDDSYTQYYCIFTGMPVMTMEAVYDYNDGEKSGWVGRMDLTDPYHTASYQNSACTFAVRGSTSASLEKKGYSLELTHTELSLLGMRMDDKWNLNALYDDAGLIHNEISYELWNEIAATHDSKTEGKDFSIEQEYIELILNGEYAGVFGLQEKINKKNMELTDNDIMYKMLNWRIPATMIEASIFYELRFPKQDDVTLYGPALTWSQVFAARQSQNFDAAVSIIHLDNTIDYGLFCMLISGTDNTRKNLYYIARAQQNGIYKLTVIPWDLNATWGNVWNGEVRNNTLYDRRFITYTGTIEGEDRDSVWFDGLAALYGMDRQRTTEFMLQRWKLLRKDVLSYDNISSLLDEDFSYLHHSGAYARNFERWPNGKEYWKDEYIYEYAKERLEFLDGYYQELYDACH